MSSDQRTAKQRFPYHKQPLKGLYVAYTLAVITIKLPWWILSYTVPSLRPRRSWSLKKFLLNNLLQKAWSAIGQIGYPPEPLSDKVESQKKGAVWITAAPNSLIRGDVKTKAELNDVQPIDIPGFWYGVSPDTTPIQTHEKILIHLHGGGYFQSSAHSDDLSANVTKSIIKTAAPAGVIHRALAVEYRLSSSAPYHQNGQYPSGLIDTLSAYLYVLSLGVKPENVLISGDSAGGHLAQSFIRYLIDNDLKEAPVPTGGLILLSPWFDMSGSHNIPNSSYRTNENSDFLGSEATLNYAIDSFLYRIPRNETFTNPYLSPGTLDLQKKEGLYSSRWPRTFIAAGEAEMWRDQIRTVKDKMKNDGVDVVYLEVKDASHDWLWFTWLEPENTITLNAITAWAAGGSAIST